MAPLSIVDLLAKQKAEKEAASKVHPSLSTSSLLELTSPSFVSLLQPKFLSKAERAAIALEKRQQEIDSQRGVADKAKVEREELEKKAEEERRKSGGGNQHQGGGDYGRFGGNQGYNVRGGYGGGRGGYSQYFSTLFSFWCLEGRAGGRQGGREGDVELTSTYLAFPPPLLDNRGGYQNGYQNQNQYNNNNNRPSYEDRDRPNVTASSSMPPPPGGPRQPPAGPRGAGGPTPTGPRSAPTLPASSANPSDPTIDLAAIKARYLGVGPDANKRKIRKTGDKKFVFDWDGDEDTGAGSLVDSRSAGGVMLGGSVGGIGDGGRGRKVVAGAVPDQSVHLSLSVVAERLDRTEC